jgi:hypothetical protein
MFMALIGAFMAYVFRMQLAFPGISVPGFGQVSNFGVARHICLEFFRPKLPARFRGRRSGTTVMSMPKAAMNQDHLPATGKYQIRRTGKILSMKTVSVSKHVQGSAQGHLGFRVSAPDGTHNSAPEIAGFSLLHALDHMRRALLLRRPRRWAFFDKFL